MKNIDSQLEIIKQGAAEIIQESELVEKLKSKKPLTVKVGLDPTMPDMHLGHTVVINKLRQFQKLGHNAVFLIGDYTACIGDPSGRDVTRPAVDPKTIKENSKQFQKEIFKILDKKKTRVVFNSEWLGKLKGLDLIELASHYTVARMLERDDFDKRFKIEKKPISIHEFLYPLLQAQDSVELQADVELGGTDQKFNLLLGRKLQEDHKIKPQVCIMMPILEGLDGVKKMSKSLDNYISISDESNDMFGKLMSISDDLMWRYYNLLSFKNYEDIADLILFDSTSMEKSQSIPKDLLRKLPKGEKFGLAGAINLENIEEYSQLGFNFLDLSSGLEKENLKGYKDHLKIKNFINKSSFSSDYNKDIYGVKDEFFLKITKKPIIPSSDEINVNPRSRSAKLRIGERL